MPSLLDALRQKQARVAALRAELNELEAELRDARLILSGREATAAHADALLSWTVVARPKSRHGFTGGRRAKPIQTGSSVWWTEKILKDAGVALHVDTIIERIFNESGERFLKNTLVSNLSRYVKHDDTFTRPAPSVYGLTMFEPAEGLNESPGQ